MTDPANPTQPSTLLQEIKNKDVCVIWHCRNLRTQDHPAIEFATQNHYSILPIFIFDPEFYEDGNLACDSRVEFMLESISDLKTQYESLDGGITLLHGNPVKILQELNEYAARIVTTIDPTGRYGLKRDNKVAESCDIDFIDDDGLQRNVEDTRKNWGEYVESWLNAPQHEFSEDDIDIISIETGITPDVIRQYYNIEPKKEIKRTGGTENALRLLDEFTENLSAYPGNISSPTDARSGTSQLSPYLRFGCISIRQVYQEIEDTNSNRRAKEMFKSRLYWNRHYNQKLADWEGWMDTAVNPVLEDFHEDTHDSEKVQAWKNGQTGYPMVDASMRCLNQSGWLNFRMRAMCASFLCDLLQQPWKIGADYFYYHLLDADPAINYTQFQLQAGVDGTNMMRIYNPRKQVRDNDPNGEFIKKWVPELESLPAKYLDQPEKTPIHIQENTGVSIGEDYPYPIIEYETARQDIIKKFEAIKDRAEKALQHPEVRRRASLTQRGETHESAEIDDLDSLNKPSTKTDGQSSLQEFN
jgi:deoxyribodipyrimidine photo-lyase